MGDLHSLDSNSQRIKREAIQSRLLSRKIPRLTESNREALFICPPVGNLFIRRSALRSHGPNNALQRTAHGIRVFSVFHVHLAMSRR